MLQKTVTTKCSLRYKVMYGVKGTFFSTNFISDENRMGEVALPTNLCMLIFGYCAVTTIGQQMKKLGLDLITKGFLAYHSLNIEMDKNFRFNC